MRAKHVLMPLQILYLISAFRVLPEPGFTVMDAVLLFASVSSPCPVTLSGTNTKLRRAYIRRS